MKIRIKWNIFRVLSYIQGTAIAGILAIFIFNFEALITYAGSDLDFLIFFITAMLLLFSGACIHLFLLEKKYPDKIPDKKLMIGGKLIWIFSILFIAYLFLGTCMVIYRFVYKGPDPTDMEVAVLFLITLIVFTGPPLFWLQVSLRKTIRRNYNSNIEHFLEPENE